MPYEDHKFFSKPADPTTKVWRYMDFTKFVSLLDKRELWFTRADQLNDPFEGTLSRMSLYVDGVIPEQSAEYDRFVKIVRDSQHEWRKWTVVNCWHLNEYESAAMWSLCARAQAKKRGITVTELLFENRKKMLDMNLSYERENSEENEQRIFVVDEEQLLELEELDERLKTYDPARIKRKNK